MAVPSHDVGAIQGRLVMAFQWGLFLLCGRRWLDGVASWQQGEHTVCVASSTRRVSIAGFLKAIIDLRVNKVCGDESSRRSVCLSGTSVDPS
jgi:hypothetical protein